MARNWYLKRPSTQWWGFDTIAESPSRYKVLATPSPDLWEPDWFPLFSSSDISSIGIACRDFRAPDGEIWCYEYTVGTLLEFASLEAMLKTIDAAYASGAIFMGNDRELDYDADAFGEIAKQFNPGLTRWERGFAAALEERNSAT